MTEWNASKYAKLSALQQAMAEEALALLDMKGAERVLDVGCGNGRISAEIAVRVPQGSVLGVDRSKDMIAFASTHFGPDVRPNLKFEVADARSLPSEASFDLVVSFNALHWIPDQAQALRSIRSVMAPNATAQLRLVPKGERKSLEDVIEETRKLPRWSAYFEGFRDPYLHLTPGEYAELVQENGLRTLKIHTAAKSWDFGSRAGFEAFGSVTFVEWTQFLPEAKRLDFVNDVLDHYRGVAADKPEEENTFKFYQADFTLAPA